MRAYPLSFVEEQLIVLVHVNQYVYLRKTGAKANKGIKIILINVVFA